jgi:hypothetical protein
MRSKKYDAAEFAEKARAGLRELKATKKPGEIKGPVSKTEVLELLRPEIEELIKKGYTSKDIAEAITKEAFPILPKMITEVLKPEIKAPVLKPESRAPRKKSSHDHPKRQETKHHRKTETTPWGIEKNER